MIEFMIEMVSIEGGNFLLGDKVSITVSDFQIGKYLVTQAQWRAVMGNNPAYFSGCDDCPVENVSWNDVQDFLKKLNARFPGKNYRLLTEAEWEYAARGGMLSKGFEYAGSEQLKEVAWFSENSGSKTHPVGGKKANELGLYDMSGNVWEWCADWYEEYLSGGQTNLTGSTAGSFRVLRGGSWLDDPEGCRVSDRDYYSPDGRNNDVGFRLAN